MPVKRLVKLLDRPDADALSCLAPFPAADSRDIPAAARRRSAQAPHRSLRTPSAAARCKIPDQNRDPAKTHRRSQNIPSPRRQARQPCCSCSSKLPLDHRRAICVKYARASASPCMSSLPLCSTDVAFDGRATLWRCRIKNAQRALFVEIVADFFKQRIFLSSHQRFNDLRLR